MILTDVANLIAEYNRSALHYDLVAREIYQARARLRNPFSEEYQLYILAGLIVFDMARMMKQGAKGWYDPTPESFAAWLRDMLRLLQKPFREIADLSLHQISFEAYAATIENAYKVLSLPDEGVLSTASTAFHVGATKILHWIAPDLFIIVDRNTARAFEAQYRVGYRNTTQPGYTAEKYLKCLRHAQNETVTYGYEKLCSHEPGTPIARIFDKVAFIAGRDLK